MNQLWDRLSDRNPALLALVLLALMQLVAFFVPQVPVSPDDSAGFGRWLAELRPRLGGATKPLASLGLLTIRSSILLRLVLGFLALLIAANLDRLRETRRGTPWSLNMIGRLLVCLGGILVIGGWSGQMLGGWRESEVIAWPEAEIVIPGRGLTLSQPSGTLGLWQGGYGYYVVARGQRTGLEIQATDSAGDALLLLPSVDEAPLASLRLTFTTQEPEAFFAIQEAGLVFRLNQIQDSIQVQAYRSASGQLLSETLLPDETGPTMLSLEEAAVRIDQTLLPRYEVIYNPGAAFEGLGLVLYAAGVVMSIVAHPSTDYGDETGPVDPTPVSQV